MIERYSLPKMNSIWSQENKFQQMLNVELAICKAWNNDGKISDKDLNAIITKSKFQVDRIKEIENVTHHDVIAFVSNVAENIGVEGRFVHMGATSSDILDSGLALQMKEAVDLLIKDLETFSSICKLKAIKYKSLLTIGRTHGIHAEPTSFGLKFALWYSLTQQNIKRLKELADQRRRFGCKRLHVLLRREGYEVNHKRTERLYREEGLCLRKRKRKRISHIRLELPRATRPNQYWAMDFVTDTLFYGRRIRALAVIDLYTRESLAIEVDHSLSGQRVVRILERLIEQKGVPEAITSDNGPEFTSIVMDKWAHENGIKLDFIRPGKPIENAYAESFMGRFRDECLNENVFVSLDDARKKVLDWREDYNFRRPHSSLNNMTPMEFYMLKTTEIANLEVLNKTG